MEISRVIFDVIENCVYSLPHTVHITLPLKCEITYHSTLSAVARGKPKDITQYVSLKLRDDGTYELHINPKHSKVAKSIIRELLPILYKDRILFHIGINDQSTFFQWMDGHFADASLPSRVENFNPWEDVIHEDFDWNDSDASVS